MQALSLARGGGGIRRVAWAQHALHSLLLVLTLCCVCVRARDAYASTPLPSQVYPSPSVQSDAEIDDYVRRTVHSANALTGSCRMGHDNDPNAVLDPEMRVRGIGSLRVIDASAMPHIVGGQTCAPTIMMAEKGADLVLRQRAALRSYSQHAQMMMAQQAAASEAGGRPAAAA